MIEETYDGWPCPWMPALVKEWLEEDLKAEELAFIEIVDRIVTEND